MTRLVQLRHGAERRVALVDEPRLRLLDGVESVYALALEAIANDASLAELVARRAYGASLDYDAIHAGLDEWRLLTPIDHPEPARCLVSGTGLTHYGSAKNRDAMHVDPGHADSAALTDSMRMFRAGVDGGRPAAGEFGVAPEWFHKGTGTTLRAHGEPLVRPAYAEDGGEEAEVAGVYVIDAEGRPRRVGMSPGNEFSDHRFEKRNYLNLAGSKLRNCALGPELVIDASFASVCGTVAIERDGSDLWSQRIWTGEAAMCHSLQNLEHHHFKFEAHRRPGDVHVYYFGACSLSFGDGVCLADGDVMRVCFDGFGRALRNPMRADASPASLVTARPLA